MNISLLKLNIKQHILFYIGTIMLIYVALTSQQEPILLKQNLTEQEIVELFESTQKYLLLVVPIWNYFAFRLLTYSEYSEIIVEFHQLMWWGEQLVLYFLICFPYFLWFGRQNSQLSNGLPFLIIEIFLFSGYIFLIIRWSASALTGLVIGIVYYFLMWNHWLPDAFCLAYFGILPQLKNTTSYLFQTIPCLIGFAFSICKFHRIQWNRKR
jgi:hypothetical protein